MGKTSSKIAVIAALTTLYPTFAAPQQPGGAGATPAANPGGVQLDFGVSTGLILDDNFKLSTGGGTGLSKISDTKLSFGLSNITAVDQLTFRSSGKMISCLGLPFFINSCLFSIVIKRISLLVVV